MSASSVEKPLVYLEVPMIKQNDVKSEYKTFSVMEGMACWLASAEMVLAYRSVALSLTIANLNTIARWFSGSGLPPGCVKDFASEVGLNIDQSNIYTNNFTPESVAVTLSRSGPLWTWIQVGSGFGHIVVVTGVSKNTIYVNDPSDPTWADSYPFNEFTMRRNWSVPMLYKLTAGVF